MALTQEEKEARKVVRLAKEAEEKESAHREFLEERERFRNDAPRKALELLARAEKMPGAFIHTKVIDTTCPNDGNYCAVLFWTGDEEFREELCVWEKVATTPGELNCLRWELQSVIDGFDRFEEEVNAERERERKRRELLERLSAEERELLGV
jgi:hypothetical protein